MRNQELLTWLAVSLLGLAVTPTMAGTAAAAAAAAPDWSQAMRQLDANHDRRLDADELARGQELAAVLLSLTWEDCDRDHDGVVRPAEFEAAAGAARQTLAGSTVGESDDATAQLAEALSLGVLLEQLGSDATYADELAALREAVEDLDDDETVYTHIIQNPARYPKLLPLTRTYVRYYPLRPALRRYYHPRHPLAARYRVKAHPHPKPGPKAPAVKPKSHAAKPPHKLAPNKVHHGPKPAGNAGRPRGKPGHGRP